MNTADTIKKIEIARRVSTPLMQVGTADPMAFVAALLDVTARWSNVPPIVLWDPVRAFSAINTPGTDAKAAFVPEGDGFSVPGANLVEALGMMAKAPARTLIVMLMAPRLVTIPGVEGAAVVQGILNLRDLFKGDGRTLLMLGHSIALPSELRQDVLTLTEPLPSESELQAMITSTLADARKANKRIPEPEEHAIPRGAEALAGLPYFAAEQALAITLAGREALDVADLWDAKRAIVEQQANGGLKFEKSRLSFADVGGLDAARAFAEGLFSGPRPPRCVVRIDEIEKALAGIRGDTSGVSTDQLGVLLQEMEDRKWTGLIAAGPPGAGKSLFSKVIGGTFGIPTLQLDLGALKGSLVGESEENIRTAMRTLAAIGADDVFFVATSNDISIIPPELARRFRFGVWMFDLPTAAERAAIWALHLKTFNLEDDDTRAQVDDKDWTGAEIWTCCELAYRLRKPLAAVQAYVVPVARRDSERIDRLRRTAHGKWLCASNPGVYRHTPTGPASANTPAASGARRNMES
jgi:hypothetical protein